MARFHAAKENTWSEGTFAINNSCFTLQTLLQTSNSNKYSSNSFNESLLTQIALKLSPRDQIKFWTFFSAGIHIKATLPIAIIFFSLWLWKLENLFSRVHNLGEAFLSSASISLARGLGFFFSLFIFLIWNTCELRMQKKGRNKKSLVGENKNIL